MDQLLYNFAVVFDCIAVADFGAVKASKVPLTDSAAAEASKVARVLLHLTGLAKVIHSTLHCVWSGEQNQEPETFETDTPQVPAADGLPCWTRHGWLQPDTTLVALSV